MDILSLLKKDHKKVNALLSKLEKTTPRSLQSRTKNLEILKNELLMHEDVEHELLYPVLAERKRTHQLTLECYEEHHVVNFILSDLESADPYSDVWLAKLTVLKENISHHVDEEENRLFPKAAKMLTEQELESLGKEMRKKKKHNS